MTERDSRGRRRQPGQERGLRPLHPILPERWVSKPLRVAMSEQDWDRFEVLVRATAPDAPTQARAYGRTLAQLVNSVPEPKAPTRPPDWMDWERKKTLRLLFPGK